MAQQHPLSATTPYIPNEVWRCICDHLSRPRDLVALSCTSKSKHALIQPFIHRYMVDCCSTSLLPSIARQGNLELIKMLSSYKNFQANAQDSKGRTALLCAIEKGETKITNFLINMPGNHDHINMRGPKFQPLSLAARDNRITIVQQLLLQPELDVNARDHDKGTALHRAVGKNHLQIINLLLSDDRVNPYVEDHHSFTASGLALLSCRYYIFKAFLDNSVQLPDSRKQRISMETLLHGRRFTLQRIPRGKDRPRSLKNDCYALTCAAAYGHISVVTTLLEYMTGGWLECGLRDALLFSAGYGHIDIVELLLRYIRPDFQDKSHRTPEWYTTHWGHYAIAKLLKAARQDDMRGRKRKRYTTDNKALQHQRGETCFCHYFIDDWVVA